MYKNFERNLKTLHIPDALRQTRQPSPQVQKHTGAEGDKYGGLITVHTDQDTRKEGGRGLVCGQVGIHLTKHLPGP